MLIYVYELISLACLFVIASISLNLIVARTGLFSLAHGGLLGIGAYLFAIAVLRLGIPPAVAILLSMAGTAFFGALLAAPSINLDEEKFAVVTLSIHLLIVVSLINWVSVTGGAYGIAEIPKLTLLGIDPQLTFTGLILAITIGTYWFMSRLENSRFGLLLYASAVDPAMVESLGGRVWRLKVAAFAIGSAGAGLAGSVYAMHAGYIAPNLFELQLSVMILAMVIFGGAKSMAGAAIGAIVLTLIPELLRFAAFSTVSAGPVRQIVFGCILVLAVFVHARGSKGQHA